MPEFEADGIPHRTRRLSAYDQFHLLRRIEPVLPAVLALDVATAVADPGLVTGALHGIAPAAITEAFDAVAGAVERDNGEGWTPGTKAVPLPIMLAMTLAVVEANFIDYLSRQRPSFEPVPQPRPMWRPVEMPDRESWLFRPCEQEPPLIDMLAIFDGRATLFQVAKANDLIDVRSENEARALAAPKGN